MARLFAKIWRSGTATELLQAGDPAAVEIGRALERQERSAVDLHPCGASLRDELPESGDELLGGHRRCIRIDGAGIAQVVDALEHDDPANSGPVERIAPEAPKASAVRMMVPALPGSCTLTRTTTSG